MGSRVASLLAAMSGVALFATHAAAADLPLKAAPPAAPEACKATLLGPAFGPTIKANPDPFCFPTPVGDIYVGGALSGALGGLMQPLTQIPQQLAQTGQQLMGSMKDMGGKTPEELGAEGLGGGLPGAEDASKLGEGGGGSGSGGSGGGGIGSTTPTAMLGPPATPSAATTPTAGRTMPAAPAPSGPPPSAPMTGMGGMGGMPHGGMGGGGGESKDDKAATKRVAVPSIKNGAPVQGRIATPPSAPTVAKKVDGKTVASKRIVVPSDRANDKTEGDDKDR